jgi:hypothetical protein
MSTSAPPEPRAANRPRAGRSRKAGSSGITQAADAAAHTESPTTTTTNKSRRRRHNQKPHFQQSSQQQQLEDPAPGQNPVSPLTPPRGHNQKGSNGVDAHVSPIVAGAHLSDAANGKGKRNGNNAAGRDNTTTPKSCKSRSPQPPQQTELTSPTPAKAAQIYAGPTFHASPAASSLPIPKFFSKSMPQVNNKDASLQAMMAEDVSEGSTSQGDESPTLRNAVAVDDARTRQDSPLDIFFKADRAEKARQQFGSPLHSISTPNDRFRASSASPARFSPSHQSRPNTEHGMFALEMDGEPRKSGTPSGTKTPLAPAENKPVAASPGKTDVEKTEALKQLLFFKSQNPTSHGPQSPSASPTPPRTGLSYGASPSARSPSASPYSPVYGNTLSESRPGPPRLHSSQLRQEVSADSVSELPTTPTPARSQFMGTRTQSYDSSSQSQNTRRESPAPRFAAQDALRATFGNDRTGHDAETAMEDTLRRILKLDLLPSTGVR